MSALTKKPLTKKQAEIKNISFEFHGHRHTYHTFSDIPDAEIVLIAQELAASASLEWEQVFRESRDRVGGVEAYRKSAARVRGARNRDGLTQEEVSKKLGIRQSNLSAIENARAPIGKRLALKLAEVFKSDYKLFLTDLPE